MIFNTTTKSLFASFFIHILLIGGYFVYIYEKPLKVASKEKTISMDLQTVTLPKQNIEKPKPKKIEKQKKIEKPKPKPKPIKKPEPKHKPIIKEKPKPKKIEPKKEQIKPTIKPKPIQAKKIEKPTKTKQIANKQTQQQAFRKTNFAIIRDMVLENLNYPKIARRMKWQGVVKVKLVIDTNGKLTHYEIVKSSKRKHLDNAALEAVESLLNRVLPKPKTQTTLILPISFKLQ